MGIFPINIRNNNNERLENQKYIQPQVSTTPVAAPQIRPEQKGETDFMKLGSVPNNQSGTYSAAARISPVLKSFLDKVASGTATDTDLQAMQNKLQQAQPYGNGQSGTQNGKASDVKIFLEKVSNGTVTKDDLSNMQTKLQQVRQNSGSTLVAEKNNHEIDLGFFLKKVANGTVNKEDLQNTRDVLKQMEQSGNDAFFRHQHKMDSYSNNNGSDLKNFLGKVADNSVSDDDIKNMQNELQKMERHFGFM